MAAAFVSKTAHLKDRAHSHKQMAAAQSAGPNARVGDHLGVAVEIAISNQLANIPESLDVGGGSTSTPFSRDDTQADWYMPFESNDSLTMHLLSSNPSDFAIRLSDDKAAFILMVRLEKRGPSGFINR